MVKSYEKKNIRPPRPKTIQHVDKRNFRKPKAKSKKDIAEEKSFVTKQRIKEKEKATTKSEKKDLDATPKRKFRHPIFKDKGKSIDLKKKPKVKIKPKSKDKIAKEKSKNRLELMKERGEKMKNKVSTPEKHPAHDPDKGGGIHKGKPPKGKYEKKSKGGAQAAEVKKKPLSPEQKKKDKAIMKAEEARRKKAKSKAKSEKAKKDSAPIMKAEKKRRAEGKKDIPTGRSAAASGYVKREDAAARKKHVLGTLKDKPSGRK
jgi:hypothetical protein